MTQLADDQILGRVLRGEPPPQPGVDVFTTGYWYVRLVQAALNANERGGKLSDPFAALPEPARTRAMDNVLMLPTEIGVLSLRQLGPTIGRLRAKHDLNILAIEALASAVMLRADVFLSAHSPRLETALRAEGRVVTVLP